MRMILYIYIHIISGIGTYNIIIIIIMFSYVSIMMVGYMVISN